MIRHITLAAVLLAVPALAQNAEAPTAPSPGEIVAQAAPSDWIAIAPDDLLVMRLAPDRDGNPRRAVIQLMPPPFSQPWVENIRTLAKAHWWDGLAIVRVQDNYVVQWGDPEAEDKGKARVLPEELRATSERDYTSSNEDAPEAMMGSRSEEELTEWLADLQARGVRANLEKATSFANPDIYSGRATFFAGWPVGQNGGELESRVWPVHCYATVGVGRGMSPDTGTGAELYAVIGHAPRHLDRNIAVVGRVVEGIEHLSSLPRGTGPLGFYETGGERVPIASIRLASELPEGERPRFEYLSTEGETFARYADARANRRDPFFIVPAGGADICNIPVPVRRVADAGE